ncbi:chloride channel protein [Candidatus Bathyarchaeota archaeon]|nr:chloride channel protein [Candidatus Bathyarchaeota archaeon]
MIRREVKIWCKINGLALLAGIAGGLGAIIFRKMIWLFKYLFFQLLLPRLTINLWGYNLGVMILPALGGLIAGPIIEWISPETRGHGVPEVMDAVHTKGGDIRGRVAMVKTLVSSITIGSGGSVGREGPIAQIGAAIGSLLGRIAGFDETYRRLLVVCGLSAGISGTFMAPLGGAIFGLEVIYRGVAPYDVIPILLSSVVGMVVTGEVFGLKPAFKAPEYVLKSPLDVLYFLPLGIIFGLLAIIWTRMLYLMEDLFDRLPIRRPLRPALGGLLTGLMGVFLAKYGILGVGYEGIDLALSGTLPAWLLLLLGVMKMLATSLTVGSGGSGGIFAPSLYMGAMFGGFFASILSGLPLVSRQPSIYYLVGMAALFAGAAKAPLTCMIMLPEMTDNYHLLPALMVACSMSYFISALLMKGSIYTLKLKRRGVEIEHTVDPLKLVKVSEIMTPLEKVVSVRKDTPLSILYFMILESKHTAFPVLDDGRLVGIVTLKQLSGLRQEEIEELRVKDILKSRLVVTYPDETAYDVLEKMNQFDVEILPVVDRADEGKLLGVVSKRDTLNAILLGKRKMRLLE